jgi:hypothetical protein
MLLRVKILLLMKLFIGKKIIFEIKYLIFKILFRSLIEACGYYEK